MDSGRMDPGNCTLFRNGDGTFSSTDNAEDGSVTVTLRPRAKQASQQDRRSASISISVAEMRRHRISLKDVSVSPRKIPDASTDFEPVKPIARLDDTSRQEHARVGIYEHVPSEYLQPRPSSTKPAVRRYLPPPFPVPLQPGYALLSGDVHTQVRRSRSSKAWVERPLSRPLPSVPPAATSTEPVPPNQINEDNPVVNKMAKDNLATNTKYSLAANTIVEGHLAMNRNTQDSPGKNRITADSLVHMLLWIIADYPQEIVTTSSLDSVCHFLVLIGEPLEDSMAILGDDPSAYRGIEGGKLLRERMTPTIIRWKNSRRDDDGVCILEEISAYLNQSKLQQTLHRLERGLEETSTRDNRTRSGSAYSRLSSQSVLHRSDSVHYADQDVVKKHLHVFRRGNQEDSGLGSGSRTSELHLPFAHTRRSRTSKRPLRPIPPERDGPD